MSISDTSARSISFDSIIPGNIISNSIKNKYSSILEESITYSDKTPQDLALENLTNALRWYDVDGLNEPTIQLLVDSVSRLYRLRFYNSIIAAGALLFMWKHGLDIDNHEPYLNFIVTKIISFYETSSAERSKRLTKEVIPLLKLEIISYMKAISDFKKSSKK